MQGNGGDAEQDPDAGAAQGTGRATAAQLRQAARLASLGTLARGMAHEINNPLTSIVGGLQFLAAELDELGALLPPDRLHDLRSTVLDAQQGAARVRALVSALQRFGRDAARIEPLELRRVLDLAASLAGGQLRNRARLVRDYGELPSVAGDEARLGLVFVTLLANAAKAIAEGRPDENEVRVAARPGADGVEVEVRDTGCGIPEGAQRRLGEPFFTVGGGEGIGLGLYLARALVEEMGGRLRFESAPGRGSSFFVLLPFPQSR